MRWNPSESRIEILIEVAQYGSLHVDITVKASTPGCNHTTVILLDTEL